MSSVCRQHGTARRLHYGLYLANAPSGKIVHKLTSTASDQHYTSIQFIYSAGAWDASSKRIAIAGPRPEWLYASTCSGTPSASSPSPGRFSGPDEAGSSSSTWRRVVKGPLPS
jgi:hypothetical protein